MDDIQIVDFNVATKAKKKGKKKGTKKSKTGNEFFIFIFVAEAAEGGEAGKEDQKDRKFSLILNNFRENFSSRCRGSCRV